jgi:hypothetical protein
MKKIFVVPDAWGQNYHSGIPSHVGWVCPECMNGLSNVDEILSNPGGWYSHIIGFSCEIPGGSIRSRADRGDRQVIGCVIVSCPHCHSKFFIHVTVDEVKMAIKKCSNWPKTKKLN